MLDNFKCRSSIGREMPNFCLKCAKMKEDCCRSDYAKFTTLKDAERIARFLDVPVNKVVIYSPLSKKDKKTQLYLKKIHGYYYDLESKEGKILQLKKREDGACFFLSKTGRCRIYEVRPLICQVFPFWYSPRREIMIDHNGLNCDIVKDKITSAFQIKAKERENILREFCFTSSNLKKLLAQLKREIKAYKKNIDDFVSLNKIK